MSNIRTSWPLEHIEDTIYYFCYQIIYLASFTVFKIKTFAIKAKQFLFSCSFCDHHPGNL